MRVPFARWLDDHLLEFTYRGRSYEIVRVETAELLRRPVRDLPPLFWNVTTRGARTGDLIVQFRHGIFAVIHTQISSDAPDTLFHRLDTEGVKPSCTCTG